MCLLPGIRKKSHILGREGDGTLISLLTVPLFLLYVSAPDLCWELCFLRLISTLRWFCKGKELDMSVFITIELFSDHLTVESNKRASRTSNRKGKCKFIQLKRKHF